MTVALITLNAFSDLEEGASVLELVLDSIETLLMVTDAADVGMVLDRMRVQHSEKLALIESLSIAKSEGAAWRRRVEMQAEGIGAEIERQFSAWGLTAAEREVGTLILKGLSHKEIAALRGTSEATVRQQARSIYQRSSLPSKSAFAAYFLEDLLPPAYVASQQPRTVVEPLGSSVADTSANCQRKCRLDVVS